MLTSLTILFTVVVLLITYFIAEKVTRYNWAKTTRTELEREKQNHVALTKYLTVVTKDNRKYVIYELEECAKKIKKLERKVELI